MIFPFCDKPEHILRWANQKGYYGTPYDAIYLYFQNNTTLGANGKLYDYVLDALNKQGYYGTIADCLIVFFYVQTGVWGRMDSERKFWDNSSLTFFGSAGILDDSGNQIKDDSGNIILDDSGN